MGYNKFIVDTNALKFNVEKIKTKLDNGVKFCAVVKANAYGHGCVNIANLIKEKCDYFAVACVKEAMELRDRNIDNNILVLGIVTIKQLKYCIFNNISITLSSLTQLYDILNALKALNLNNDNLLKIHIKINTGLNRLGFNNVNDFVKAIDIIGGNSNIKLCGIFTHFATKADDKNFIIEQYNLFKKYVNYIDDKCINIHCNNTYATFNLPEFSCSMVRCGFAIYGWSEGLKPVLNITSEIVNICNVDSGTVGYDRTFKAVNKKIAVMPIGYADGFDRRLSNNFKVIVNGEFVDVVGNVCMDMTMLDVTNVKGVKVGSKVTLLGVDNDKQISVYDYANALNTSPYEVLLKFKSTRMDYIEI